VDDQQVRDERTQPSGKRKYSPPDITTQQVFETTALACGKLIGQGGAKCGPNPRTS
jgi:hypothetical protein